MQICSCFYIHAVFGLAFCPANKGGRGEGRWAKRFYANKKF